MSAITPYGVSQCFIIIIIIFFHNTSRHIGPLCVQSSTVDFALLPLLHSSSSTQPCSFLSLQSFSSLSGFWSSSFPSNLLVSIPMQWKSHLHPLPNQSYLPASLSLTVFKYLGALRWRKDNTYGHKTLVSTSTFALNSKRNMNVMHQANFKQLKKQLLHGVHEKRWTVFEVS